MLLLLGTSLVTGSARWLLGALACGDGFAWIGHFFLAKNRPATSRHPIHSFPGDWTTFRDMLRGRIHFQEG